MRTNLKQMKQLRNSWQRNIKPQKISCINKNQADILDYRNTIAEMKTQCMGSTVKCKERISELENFS